MNLKNGHRMVRVPAPIGRNTEGTAILDKEDKLVAYSRNIISANDKKAQFDWVRADQKV